MQKPYEHLYIYYLEGCLGPMAPPDPHYLGTWEEEGYSFVFFTQAAGQSMANLLQAHPEIDAVFACNDMMALGAVEAVRAAGRSKQIRIIGFDAVEDARRAIQAGEMEASVAQHPAEMGRVAVESAVKLIRGETVPAEQVVPIELVSRDTLADGDPPGES